MSDGWIVIPNWSRYQHYSDRAPAWIKDHISQLDDDEYVKLTNSQRGLLSGLRLMFAASDGRLPKSASGVSHRLRCKVSERQLDALADAGFIEFRASRPLALTRARERALEEKNLEEKNKPRAHTREGKPQTTRQNAAGYQQHQPDDQTPDRLPLELVETYLAKLKGIA